MKYRSLLILALLAIVLVSVAPLSAQDTGECEDGFRYFDHEFLATEPTCIPDNPQRVAYLLYPSYIYPFGVNPVGSWGLERDAANFPYIADWIMEGTVDHGMPPSLEFLLELDPDLLLYDVSRVTDVLDELPNIAPLVTFDDTRAYTWQERHRFNAEVFNQVELAEAQIADYEARVEELRLAVAETYGDVSDITVSVIRLRGEGAYSPVGSGWTSGNVLADVGFDLPDAFELSPEEIIETFGDGRLILGDESIPLFNGDIILFVGSPGGAQAQEAEGDPLIEAILQDPLWQTLDAFATNDVYTKGDYWLQDGALPAHMVIDDLIEILNVEIDMPNPFLTAEDSEMEVMPEATEEASD